MRKLLRAASLSLSLVSSLSASLLVGCGSDEDLSLDSLPVVTTEDEKSDKAGSPSFYWVRPSATPIYCIKAPCATTEVRQVNTPFAQLIYKFDWRGLKLSSADQMTAESQRSSMLLYGKYTSATAFGEKVTVFQVTRASLQVSDITSDDFKNDSYYSVKALTTPSCTSGTCPTLVATMLGNGVVGPIQLVGADLSRLSQDPTLQNSLAGELKAGTAYMSVTGIKSLVANVSQVFRPFGAPPLKK